MRKKERDEKEAEKRKEQGLPVVSPVTDTDLTAKPEEESDDEQRMNLSEDEAGRREAVTVSPGSLKTPATPADLLTNGDRLKRKRSGEEEMNDEGLDDVGSTPSKRLRSETPPPPPPPPEEISPRGTTPSDTPQSPSRSKLRSLVENHHLLDNAASEPPPGPLMPSILTSTDADEMYETNNAGATSMIFNGMNGTFPEDNEIETDKRDSSMERLGMGYVPELQLREGH